MKQLVQLQENLAQFKGLRVKVIGLLRNEPLRGEGLKLAQKKTKAEFPLGYDIKAKATRRYAPRFTIYLIDKSGIIRAILPPEDGKRPVKPSVIIEELKKLRKAE